jgi:predicted Zn-dependent protease
LAKHLWDVNREIAAHRRWFDWSNKLIYLKEGHVDGAETQFREELKRFPADAVSNCLLRQIVIERNEAGEARSLFLIALTANPRYKEALFWARKSRNQPRRSPKGARPAAQSYPARSKLLSGSLPARCSPRLGHQDEAKKEREICASIQAKQRAEYAKKLPSQ